MPARLPTAETEFDLDVGTVAVTHVPQVEGVV